jgi:hypothetical protein
MRFNTSATENMPWTLIPNRITVKTINLQFYENRIIIELADTPVRLPDVSWYAAWVKFEYPE